MTPITRPALLAALVSTALTACGAAPRAEPAAALDTSAAEPAPPDPPTAAPAKRTAKRAAKRATRRATQRPAHPAAPPAEPPAAEPPAAELPAAELPAAELPAAEPPAIPGSRHLARLHPEVRRMARALHAEAAAAGIALKFISGHRPFDRHSRKAKAGRASWHAFGMAFDVNLAHHRTMRDALKRYDAEVEQWARVGAIAERLGLTWGLQWKRAEVFHFEWHPGMPEAIRRPTLRALLEDAGPDGRAIEKVWRRFPLPTPRDGSLAARDEPPPH